MAYRRWSDCDVYVCKHAHGGWATHVASRRNSAGNPPNIDYTTAETVTKSCADRVAWFKNNTDYVEIDLPSAGMTFNDATSGECAARLERLREEGFDVPQYVINELRAIAALAGGKDE